MRRRRRKPLPPPGWFNDVLCLVRDGAKRVKRVRHGVRCAMFDMRRSTCDMRCATFDVRLAARSGNAGAHAGVSPDMRRFYLLQPMSPGGTPPACSAPPPARSPPAQRVHAVTCRMSHVVCRMSKLPSHPNQLTHFSCPPPLSADFWTNLRKHFLTGVLYCGRGGVRI
jgi:hypothetical protein